MKAAVVFLLGTWVWYGTVLAQESNECPDQEDLLNDDLKCLTHCLVNFERELTAEWENEKKVNEMVELRDRVRNLEGDDCTDDFLKFQCGGDLPRCISHFLMCDGVPDCPNGADEDHCVDLSKLFAKGSRMKMYLHYDTCSEHPGLEWDFEVTSYKAVSYFPGIPEIQWMVNATYKFADYTNNVFLPTRYSYYNHANRVLVQRFKTDDSLVYYCYFDGVNYDRCQFHCHRRDDPAPCSRYTVVWI